MTGKTSPAGVIHDANDTSSPVDVILNGPGELKVDDDAGLLLGDIGEGLGQHVVDDQHLHALAAGRGALIDGRRGGRVAPSLAEFREQRMAHCRPHILVEGHHVDVVLGQGATDDVDGVDAVTIDDDEGAFAGPEGGDLVAEEEVDQGLEFALARDEGGGGGGERGVVYTVVELGDELS